MTTMQKLISPAASNEPVLSFKDVSSEYVRRKDHFIALRHIEFSLHRGEILALIGPSGCGKTTLMKVLLGTQDYGGDILLRGADIETIPLSRRGIAYIPQKNPDSQLGYQSRFPTPCTKRLSPIPFQLAARLIPY